MKAGPELDALVAEKVMGWDLSFEFSTHGKKETGWLDPVAHFIHRKGQWSPSEDIAAAWQVVEKALPGFVLTEASNQHWMACTAHVNALGETPAHAICLAALKVVGVEVEAEERFFDEQDEEAARVPVS